MNKMTRLRYSCFCAALCVLLAGCEEHMNSLNAAKSIKAPGELTAGVEEIEDRDHETVVMEIRNNYKTLRDKDTEVEEREAELKKAEQELADARTDENNKKTLYVNANNTYINAYNAYINSGGKNPTLDQVKALSKAYEEAWKIYNRAIDVRKDKENKVNKAKENLKNAQADAAKYALYHAGLVNLLMAMDESDSGKHECRYHLNGFHESVAIHVFDSNFLKNDKETMGEDDEEEEDESIDASANPNPNREDIVGAQEDDFVVFQKKIYRNDQQLYVTVSLPAYDSQREILLDENKNPKRDNHGNLLYSEGQPLLDEKGNQMTIAKQYLLEDDNQLNYFKFMSLTAMQYLNYFDYIGGKAKNVTPKQDLSDDARETACYLLPLAFTGLSDTVASIDNVEAFYTKRMNISHLSSINETLKKLYDIRESLVLPNRESIGYHSNMLCHEHLYSYHLIAQPLIDHVGPSEFNAYKSNYIGEGNNILSFVKYFEITKKKFIELTVPIGMDPSVNPEASPNAYLAGAVAFESDYIPYHVEMVYADETIANNYFSMK